MYPVIFTVSPASVTGDHLTTVLRLSPVSLLGDNTGGGGSGDNKYSSLVLIYLC